MLLWPDAPSVALYCVQLATHLSVSRPYQLFFLRRATSVELKMSPSLRVPSPHRQRDASLPRSSTTAIPSDDEHDEMDCRQPYELSSDSVTAAPSPSEDLKPLIAKHFAEDVSATAHSSPWSKKALLALGMGAWY